jgi:hypothetical protein
MRTLMARRLGGALLALGLMAAAGGIRAAPVTFEFTGTVTFSDFGTIDGGSAVTGAYTFDDGLTDADPHRRRAGAGDLAPLS